MKLEDHLDELMILSLGIEMRKTISTMEWNSSERVSEKL